MKGRTSQDKRIVPYHSNDAERAGGAQGSAQGGAQGGAVGDLLYVWQAARQHKWLVLAAFVLGVSAALGYSLLREPVYESYSAALVNAEGPQQADRSPSGPLEEALSLQRPNRTIENELQRLQRSIPLAEKVVARLDSAALVREAGFKEDAPARQRLAEYLLEERVSFEQAGEDTDVILITTTAPNPQEAARIANVYAEEYQRHSRRISQSGAQVSRSFLKEQAEERRRELEQAERELEQFMEERGAVALETKSESAVEQIASLDARLEEARTDLSVERSALQDLEARIGRIEPALQRRVSSSVQDEITALQEKVATLETLANDYYAQNPSLRGSEGQNPELASLVTRIKQARSQLDSLARQRIEEVSAVGGVGGGTSGGNATDDGLTYVSELRREAVRRRIRVGGLQERVRALQSQVGDYEGRLRALPQQSIRLAQLEREQRGAEQMYLQLRERLQEVSVAEESQIGYVETIRPALVPNVPVVPNMRINLLLGAFLGLIAGMGLALARRATSLQLRTPDELRALGFELVGLIPERRRGDRRWERVNATASSRLPPQTEAASSGGNSECDEPPFPLWATEAEAFRHIRTNVQFRREHDAPQVIAVTSPRMGEGKTSVALGLADVMAQAGRRTLFVDADLRRPAGHRYLGIDREAGLSDLLLLDAPPSDWSAFRVTDRGCPVPSGDDQRSAPGGASPRGDASSREGASQENASLQVVRTGEVYVVPAGRAVQNASELLSSPAMERLFEKARHDFDVVIVDMPPLLTVTDPVLTATHCDATLLVAAAGQTSRPALLHARARLESVGAAAPLLGVVLNRIDATAAEMLEYGYDYSYGETAAAS